MTTFTYLIIFSLVGGLFSLIGGVLLLSSAIDTKKIAYYVTPFAAGALLAAVFLDLLPEATHETEAETLFGTVLVGILIFFFAERFLRWFHHHHTDEGSDPTAYLIITGDTLHNALDGVAIAASFLISVPTGIVTTIAVAAHEIPQEIGDFGLLLAKGMAKKRVLLANAMSALATTGTAIGVYLLGDADALPVGVMLGLSAGFLLYIALSDVIPTIHEHSHKNRLAILQPILLVFGVLVVGLAVRASHSYIEQGHDSPVETSQGVLEEESDHED